MSDVYAATYRIQKVGNRAWFLDVQRALGVWCRLNTYTTRKGALTAAQLLRERRDTIIEVRAAR